jgi:hypothetical protein
MNRDGTRAAGRIGVVALILLLVLAAALYLYSERAAPPEPDVPDAVQPSSAPPVAREGAPEPTRPGDEADSPSSDRAAMPRAPVPATDEAPDVAPATEIRPAEPRPSLVESAARLRVQVAERLAAAQRELLASGRLLERIVVTVHSLDAEPVPLRYRPLAHVPGLPRIVPDGERWRLPVRPDPRYAPYRELFERFDVDTLNDLFDEHEPALQRVWERLGEADRVSFRARVVEVLDHLAEFELPARRPLLHRPEVLYEYVDPALEALSWGRKLLIRIGPEHARAVRARAAELAERLGDAPPDDD